MDKRKNWWNKLRESWWFKWIKLKYERDFDFYENDLFLILKEIFVKGTVSGEELKKETTLKKWLFSDFINFLILENYISFDIPKKDYVKILNNEKKLSKVKYSITPKGVNYLLNLKKIRKEKSSSEWIKWATIILAFTAIINVTDLLLNKPDTRNFIVKKSTEAISIGLELLKLFVILFVSYWIIRIIIAIVKRYFFKQKKLRLSK